MWGPTGRGAWMEGAHSSREMRPDSMGPLHKNESGEPPPGLCRQRRRRKERQHLLPAQCPPIIYLQRRRALVRKNAHLRESLYPSVLLFQDTTTPQERGNTGKEGLIRAALPPPLCFLFPAATYSQVTQLHSSGIRETPMLGLKGEKGVAVRRKREEEKSWLLNQHFPDPLRLAGWLAAARSWRMDGGCRFAAWTRKVRARIGEESKNCEVARRNRNLARALRGGKEGH